MEAMNPITQVLLNNLVLVYFLYGLAFFMLGFALAFAARQTSDLIFVAAIRPLAGFGFVHGVHEWLEMFLLVGPGASGTPHVGNDLLRLALLVSSFAMLLSFAGRLLGEHLKRPAMEGWAVGLPLGLWGIAALFIAMRQESLGPAIAELDVLARYLMAIPGALLGSWMLMLQQREFRAADMEQFGESLVWCASALFLYGVLGQVFVRPTDLPPSNVINSTLFLTWFGIPVQLFRALMAGVLTIAMLRVLRAFEEEGRRRLQQAHANEVAAREHALMVERRARAEETRLNVELQSRAQELSLLLDLSNLLTTPGQLHERLDQALRQVVQSLPFADAGIIMLTSKRGLQPQPAAVTGYVDLTAAAESRYGASLALGQAAFARQRAVCRHEDGTLLEFSVNGLAIGSACRQYLSPTTMVALPLSGQEEPEGVIVLARSKSPGQPLSQADLRLLAAVAQQMGQSIEVAALYQDVRARERLLGELLYQVVDAQEAERRRIARDLHDATAQSLTAIALGLRALESTLADRGVGEPDQLRTISSFTGDALVELRRIMADLRPPQLDDLGLLPALHWYVQEYRRRYPDITVNLTTVENWPRLAPEVETLIFRVVQEALTNVGKHAHASRVQVTLESADAMLHIRVEDNGVGFNPDQALQGATTGWGLLGMRERTQLVGGSVDIVAQAGRGTTVNVHVPVNRTTLGDRGVSTALPAPEGEVIV